MIRILFDEGGNAHHDLDLKVDSMDSFSQTADTYYLFDVFGKNESTREDAVLKYIAYFKKKIQDFSNTPIFIVFNLSDECVGGLRLSFGKKGLIKTEYVYSRDIQGHSFNMEIAENKMIGLKIKIQIEREWLLSRDSILQGLDWSIDRINKLKTSTPGFQPPPPAGDTT